MVKLDVAVVGQRLLANSRFSLKVLGWILGVIGVVIVIQTFAFEDVPHGNEDHSCFPVDAVADTANVLFTPSLPAITAFHQTIP